VNNAVDGSFTLAPNGIAFVTIDNSADATSPGAVWWSPFSGPASMLYALPSDVLPGAAAADAQNVYFSTGGFGSDAGLFSVPIGGGTVTPIVQDAGLFAGQGVEVFTLDANNIYVGTRDTSTIPLTSSIFSIPKGSTTGSLIYTAPAGLTIDNLFVDGSTLWWDEEDVIDDQPTTIQSAPIAATLSPTAFATVQQPLAITQFVESGGTVAFSNFTLGSGSGVYTLAQGGTPTLVDSLGLFPITLGLNGDVYYTAWGGIQKFTLGSGATPLPTAVTSNQAEGLAVDPSGTLYYANSNCIDKL